MKSVRSRTSSRSISRRPRGSNKQSSTRSACLEKRAKLTPAPSHVAPSGCARPRQTVLGATMDRARASTGGVRLRRNAFRWLHQVAAVRAPAAVLLALHRVVGNPDGAAAVRDPDALHGFVADGSQPEESDRRRPVHRAIGRAHYVEEALRSPEGLLHRRRDEFEGLLRVVAPEGID